MSVSVSRPDAAMFTWRPARVHPRVSRAPRENVALCKVLGDALATMKQDLPRQVVTLAGMVEMTGRRRRIFVRQLLQALCLVGSLIGLAVGQELPVAPPSSRQSMQDAWWSGPLLANSANTLPHGHFLVEPYIYDVIGPHTHAFGSRAYVEYGLIDRLTVGMIPIVGYNKVGNGTSSSG